MQSSVMICSLSQKRCNQQCFSGRRVSGDQKRAAFFTARHPAIKNVPPFSPPGTQRSKTGRRFHRWHPAVKNRPPFSSLAPSGQKQTAFFTTFGSAVKNRPPFSPLLAQRSKTDHLFHNFWLSDEKQTAVCITECSAAENRRPIGEPISCNMVRSRRSATSFQKDGLQLAKRAFALGAIFAPHIIYL